MYKKLSQAKPVALLKSMAFRLGLDGCMTPVCLSILWLAAINKRDFIDLGL